MPTLRRPRRSNRPTRPDRRQSHALRVEALEERMLLATFIVNNANGDNSSNSLGAAIIAANGSPGSTIQIKIGTGGPQTIKVLAGTPLPAITAPVTIDATTEVGYAGVPIITIDGTALGAASGDGLQVQASGVTIKGFVIDNFLGGSGINITAAGGNATVANCYIGTDPTGTLAAPNNVGITLSGTGITPATGSTIGLLNFKIGPRTFNGGNVISGNLLDGIDIGGAASDYNLIQNNFIGVTAAGTAALPNNTGASGANNIGAVVLLGQSSNNTIGGTNFVTVGPTTYRSRNIISGNKLVGVEIQSGGGASNANVIEGNYIGTDSTGAVALANVVGGVVLTGPTVTSTTIGGTTGNAKNVISGNAGAQITPGSAGSTLIEGNYIGTNANGTAGLGGGSGIDLTGSANGVSIGGTANGARNIISGTANHGITLAGSTSNVQILGNYIGTDATGTTSVPNTLNGINDAGASNVTIGGTVSGAVNVVSGNKNVGIFLQGVNGATTLIEGNFIGTNAAGTAAVANKIGIGLFDSMNVTIGGVDTVPGALDFGNLVSGNTTSGIASQSGKPVGNTYQGNFIGTDVSGTFAVPNSSDGLSLTGFPGVGTDTIGGAAAGAGNVIAGNRGNGITTTSFENALIEGNAIGTDFSGTIALGNGGNGVQLQSPKNTVGGTTAGTGNIIANNGNDGVQVLGNASVGNLIQGNSISANSVLGIKLGLGNAPTANHLPPAIGPNNFQNYPDLTQAVIISPTRISISGSLFALPGNYTLEFFDNTTANASGNGEGATSIKQVPITVPPSGFFSFSGLSAITLNAAITEGHFISATATDTVTNGTSEFSKDVLAQTLADVGVQITSGVPDPVNVGSPLTYTVTVTNHGPGTANGVVVTDTLPAGVVFQPGLSSSSDGTSLTLNSNQVIANLLPMANGDVVTLTIVVVPTAAAVPGITNNVAVTTRDFDTNATNNNDSLNTTVNAVVDLNLTGTGTPNPVKVGNNLLYTLTVNNPSQSAATGLILDDTLPGNVSFVSASSTLGTAVFTAGGTPSVSAGDVKVDLGAGGLTLAAGGSFTLTIIVTPLAAAAVPAPGSITNTATVTAAEFDPNLLNNSKIITTTVLPVTDLSIVFLAPPPAATVNVLQPLTYTLLVTNNGPNAATGVSVLDTLPTTATFNSANVTQGSFVQSGNTVTATLGNIAAGGTAAITITVTPQLAGTITDKAVVSGSEADPALANNTVTVNTTVNPVADLAFTASSGVPNPVYAGGLLTYTFTVKNNGPSTASSVVLTDNLPVLPVSGFAATSYVSGSSTTGVPPIVSGNTVTANIGPLASGASATVTIVVRPSARGASGSIDNPTGSITNNVSVASPEFDPTTGAGSDNTAVVTTTVLPAADLAVTLQASPNPVNIGGALTYTVTVTNNGPSAANLVTVTDTLPSTGITVISINPSQGTTSQSANVITGNLGPLAAGAQATITIQVMATAAGTLTNNASLGTNLTFDPNLANNTATPTNTVVTPSADLQVQLVTPATTPTVGYALNYTAIVTNAGPSDATSVMFTDTVPAGFTITSFSSSPGGVSRFGNTLTLNVPTLTNGSSATISFTAIPQSSGTVVNTVSATANEADPNLGNNTATTAIAVLDQAGTFQFSAPGVTVNEFAGSAPVTITRTNGSGGTVTVFLSTVGGGSGTPNVDYVPVTNLPVVFGPGVTARTVNIGVLANPLDKHDETVNLVLSSPTPGAVGTPPAGTPGAFLGSPSASVLTIRDTDPNNVSPVVTGFSWSGTPTAITSITLSFSKGLNASTATNLNNYHLVDAGRDSVIGTRDDRSLTLNRAVYNSSANTVTLFPSRPLRTNEFFHIDVNAGNGGVGDGASPPNLLNGGVNFDAYFARGSKLNYFGASGENVTLQISRGGIMDLSRFANGEGNNLIVLGARPHRTILKGTVRGGTTTLNSITGLGKFGDVRVQMLTPPFYVATPSYTATGFSAAAVDQVLSLGGVSTGHAKRKGAAHH